MSTTPEHRRLAEAVIEHATTNNPDLDAHTEGLIGVLASVIEGRDVLQAMGAPGDWGYGTPVGDAFLDLLQF